MKCPKCSVENIENAKFCYKCGANLEENNIKEEIISESSEPTTQVEEPINVPEEPTTQVEEPKEEPIVEVQEPTTNVEIPSTSNVPTKSNKKGLLIVVIILAIAAIGAGVWYFTKNKNNETSEQVYNTESLILIEENSKYGYIDTNGKVVITPQFDSATQFYGKYAKVAIKKEVNGIKSTIYQVIDEKGNVKAEAKYSSNIEYVDEENMWVINGQLCDSNLKTLSPKGFEVDYEDEGYFKWYNYEKKTAGIMNKSGKITYTYQFEDGEDYFSVDPSHTDESLKDTYCRVNVENEKYAIVNCNTGKVIYDYTKDYISEHSDNIFEISDKKTYSFIEKLYIQDDKIIYKITDKRDSLYYYETGKYVQITDYDKPYNEKYSYIDITTGEISKEKPKNTEQKTLTNEWEKYTKMQKFNCSNGYGIMSGDTIKLQCEWSNIYYFDLELYKYLSARGKNYIMAKKDDKTYIINLKTNKTEAELNAGYIYNSDGSTFVSYTDAETKKKVYYNLITNKAISFESDITVRVYSNYIVANENGKKVYYNTELKQIYTEK